MGYLAILSFNTRSSIFGWVLFFPIFLIHEVFLNKKLKSTKKVWLILFSVFGSAIALLLIFNFNFGARLIDLGLIDNSSAAARIKIWEILDSYSINNFFWGISRN